MTNTEAATARQMLGFVRPIGTACAVCLLLLLCTSRLTGAELPAPLGELIRQTCVDCHDGAAAEGGLDLTSLAFTLDDRELRERWILIHDRVKSGEMPPDESSLSDGDRQSLVKTLHDLVAK
ncbi:MAG: c-type cytochrome domain-containing protein, partial [Fuerstiella sp.]